MAHKGEDLVRLLLPSVKKSVVLPEECRVKMEQSLVDEVERLLGSGTCRVAG